MKTSNRKKAKYIREPIFVSVKECLDNWVEEAEQKGFIITGEVLRQKWHDFADIAGISQSDRLKLSDGWLTSYKDSIEAASSRQETVASERQRLQAMLADYHPDDIYNMDETALFYGMPPDKSLSSRIVAGVKEVKQRLTYAFCVNYSESEKCPPLIIGKANKPRAFRKKTGKQLDFDYVFNKKARMTTRTMYCIYSSSINGDGEEEERKVIQEPVPTCQELMKPTTEFQNNLSLYTNNLGTTEVVLEKELNAASQFGDILRKHQSKNLTSTRITDFFT